jgi:hypothetical protein
MVQTDLSQPLPEFHREAVCFSSVLESEYIVVAVLNDNDAVRVLTNCVSPTQRLWHLAP